MRIITLPAHIDYFPVKELHDGFDILIRLHLVFDIDNVSDTLAGQFVRGQYSRLFFNLHRCMFETRYQVKAVVDGMDIPLDEFNMFPLEFLVEQDCQNTIFPFIRNSLLHIVLEDWFVYLLHF